MTFLEAFQKLRFLPSAKAIRRDNWHTGIDLRIFADVKHGDEVRFFHGGEPEEYYFEPDDFSADDWEVVLSASVDFYDAMAHVKSGGMCRRPHWAKDRFIKICQDGGLGLYENTAGHSRLVSVGFNINVESHRAKDWELYDAEV